MPTFHVLLRRQWRRFFGSDRPVPDDWHGFLQAVSQAYDESDAGRLLVERALELSSKELHDANAELRGVLQVLPDLLFRVQADNRICAVMQGGSVLEAPAIRGLEHSSPGDTFSASQQFWSGVEQARRSQTAVAFEYSIGQDGQGPFYEMRLLPFVGHDLIGIVRDVTLREQAERALRESEARSVLAQRAGHVGVFDWNLASEEVFWSAEAEEIFGLPRGTFAGNHASWRERVVESDRLGLDSFFKRWLDSGREDDCWEYRVTRADRQEHWVESKGHVFRDASGRPTRIVGTHLDITTRKQAEHDRLVLGKLESTGILAGGIAHDFNNLLAGMLMSLQTARSSKSTVDEMRESIEEMERAVLAAKSLTQQLITFARGGASVRQPTDLGKLLRESFSLVLSGSSVRSEVFVASETLAGRGRWQPDWSSDSQPGSQCTRSDAERRRRHSPGQQRGARPGDQGDASTRGLRANRSGGSGHRNPARGVAQDFRSLLLDQDEGNRQGDGVGADHLPFRGEETRRCRHRGIEPGRHDFSCLSSGFSPTQLGCQVEPGRQPRMARAGADHGRRAYHAHGHGQDAETDGVRGRARGGWRERDGDLPQGQARRSPVRRGHFGPDRSGRHGGQGSGACPARE